MVPRGRKGVGISRDNTVPKVCGDGNVIFLTWIDKGVQILTKIHEVIEERHIERWSKGSRFTSKNSARVREVFGESVSKLLPITKLIADWNHFMGCVEISDQLQSVYISHMESRWAWLWLLFWALGTLVSNSYIILWKIENSWENLHRIFLQDLAWDLVEGREKMNSVKFSENSEMTKTHSGGSHVESIKLSKEAPAGGYVTGSNQNQRPTMKTCEQHMPERAMTATDRRWCYQFRQLEVDQRKTAIKWWSCDPYLCLEPGWNWFLDLHVEGLGKKN